MSWKTLSISETGSEIVVIEFRTKRGVMNRELVGELRQYFEGLIGGPSSIRLVIMRGGADAFSSGGDIAEHLPSSINNKFDGRKMLIEFHDLFRLLLKPRNFRTVCVAHNYALGGAATWLLFADLSYIVKGSIIRHPEIELSCMSCVGTALYPIFAPQTTIHRWLLGNPISVDELREHRLVDGVFDSIDDAVTQATKCGKRSESLSLRLDGRRKEIFLSNLMYAENLYIEKFLSRPSPDFVEGLLSKVVKGKRKAFTHT